MSAQPRDRRRHCKLRRAAVAAGTVGSGVIVAGCGSRQSILTTHSPQAHNIMLLWWWMLGAAAIVFLGAIAMLAIAWFRRDTPGLPFVGERENLTEGMVLLFGIGIPVVVLVALFSVANVYLIRQTSPPAPASTAETIDVIGHQWWWEVRYPGTHAVTANEIHIPVDTRINLTSRSCRVTSVTDRPGPWYNRVPARYKRVAAQ